MYETENYFPSDSIRVCVGNKCLGSEGDRGQEPLSYIINGKKVLVK